MERNPSGRVAGSGLHPGRVAAEFERTRGLPCRSRWGTDSGSLVRGGECGRGSLPSTGRSQQPAPGRWGRGGDGAESSEISAAPPGTPRVPSGPHAGSQMMTTASHPRSNKKESVPRALPPLVACLQGPGGLQWPRAQAAASPSPNPARKCEAARSAAHTPPLPASAQNFEPVHVKLSLPFQRGTELWEKLGSDDCGGWARALFFFSSTFFFSCRQSRVLAPLLSSSPSEPACPPAPFLPHLCTLFVGG